VDLLESLDDYAYALRQNDSSEYTVLAFACDSELLTANGAFDEIYLISSIDDEAQVTAYAYHTASMVLLLDPGMGTLQDCAVFLNEMISEMDDEGKSLREENGITYYMILGEDGYVSLVISF